MEELEDLGDFGVEGLGSINPVDGDALALHAAEPCHLAFGEAADVGVKVFVHLVVGAFTTQVAGDMAVFQTIAQQAFLGYALVEQGLYLVNHAVLEAFAEADADAFDDLLTGVSHTDDDMLHIGHVGVGVGVLEVVFLYFECTEQAVARLGVSVVVKLDVGGEPGGEFLVGVGFHALAEVGVDGCVGQLVAFDHSFDVHAGTATEDGLPATRNDVAKGADKVVLELVDVVFVAGIVDVDEVIGDVGVVDVIVGQVFA